MDIQKAHEALAKAVKRRRLTAVGAMTVAAIPTMMLAMTVMTGGAAAFAGLSVPYLLSMSAATTGLSGVLGYTFQSAKVDDAKVVVQSAERAAVIDAKKRREDRRRGKLNGAIASHARADRERSREAQRRVADELARRGGQVVDIAGSRIERDFDR